MRLNSGYELISQTTTVETEAEAVAIISKKYRSCKQGPNKEKVELGAGKFARPAVCILTQIVKSCYVKAQNTSLPSSPSFPINHLLLTRIPLFSYLLFSNSHT